MSENRALVHTQKQLKDKVRELRQQLEIATQERNGLSTAMGNESARFEATRKQLECACEELGASAAEMKSLQDGVQSLAELVASCRYLHPKTIAGALKQAHTKVEGVNNVSGYGISLEGGTIPSTETRHNLSNNT